MTPLTSDSTPEVTSVGILDTSVVIELPNLSAADLPAFPTISVITLAELSVGPEVSKNLHERALRQLVLQHAEASFDPLPFDAACARRFAIQWALGDSASFTGNHHHAMLYGNVLGALERRPAVDNAEARRIVDDMWRHLTLGERASSLAKRVVKPGQAAVEDWTQTLEGKSAGTDPLSVAYQSAKTRDGLPVPLETMIPDSQAILPARLEQVADICGNCPVRNNCRVWFDPDSLYN